jgi:CobQ-like glutamine amidotransferase family enzyme
MLLGQGYRTPRGAVIDGYGAKNAVSAHHAQDRAAKQLHCIFLRHFQTELRSGMAICAQKN